MARRCSYGSASIAVDRKTKMEIILQLIKGQRTFVDICRENDLKQSEVESWMTTFMKSGEQGLKVNSKIEKDMHEQEIKDLRAKIGELVLELDARKKLQALIDREEKDS